MELSDFADAALTTSQVQMTSPIVWAKNLNLPCFWNNFYAAAVVPDEQGTAGMGVRSSEVEALRLRGTNACDEVAQTGTGLARGFSNFKGVKSSVT